MAALPPGHGTLHCTLYGTKALFTDQAARYPLKLISPQTHHPRLAAAYVITYGGGLLTGDHIHLNVRVQGGANLLLLTQGSTKIFKDRDRQNAAVGLAAAQAEHGKEGSSQTFETTIVGGSMLLMLPDPVTCFAGSTYVQRQTFRLADWSAGLVLLDWYTSGRMGRGESWAFKRYESRSDVFVNDKLVIRDNLVLADENGGGEREGRKTSFAAGLWPYLCFATVVMLGEELRGSVERIMKEFEEISIRLGEKPREVMWSASLVCDGLGVVVRIAGLETEQVKSFVKELCLRGKVEEIVGRALFDRVV